MQTTCKSRNVSEKEATSDQLNLFIKLKSEQQVFKSSMNNHLGTNKTPLLSQLLHLNGDLLPYVLQFDSSCSAPQIDSAQSSKNEVEFEPVKVSFNFDMEKPSNNFEDYFVIEPEHTKQLELQGANNSLFLSIARCILFKIHFVDKKYEFLLRNAFLNDVLPIKASFSFDSDMVLQELLRKKLCLYWLSHVVNGEFKSDCKYKNDFKNVFDFIFQVYQISVNNFSSNELFKKYAIEDLTEILSIKVIMFKNTNNQFDLIESKYLSSFYQINDYVFLTCNKNEKIQFKWLMPNSMMDFINRNLLNNESTCFLKNKTVYSNYMLIVDSSHLYACFDDSQVQNNLCLALFLKFLSESSVHTLISLNNLEFDSMIKANDVHKMINYMNDLWGQNHFTLNDLMRTIQQKKDFKQKLSKFKNLNEENLNRLIENVKQFKNNWDHLIDTLTTEEIPKQELKKIEKFAAETSEKMASSTPSPTLIPKAITTTTTTSTTSAITITNVGTGSINENRSDTQQSSKRKTCFGEEPKLTNFFKERKLRRKYSEQYYRDDEKANWSGSDYYKKVDNDEADTKRLVESRQLPPILPKTKRQNSCSGLIDKQKLRVNFELKTFEQKERVSQPQPHQQQMQAFNSNSQNEPLNLCKSDQLKSSNNQVAINEPVKSRNKTITQLKTRRSLNSCLNSLLAKEQANK